MELSESLKSQEASPQNTHGLINVASSHKTVGLPAEESEEPKDEVASIGTEASKKSKKSKKLKKRRKKVRDTNEDEEDEEDGLYEDYEEDYTRDHIRPGGGFYARLERLLELIVMIFFIGKVVKSFLID